MGKTLSLISKSISVVFAMVAFLFFKRTPSEILIISGFIAVAFAPVDASIIMANIRNSE